MAPGLQVWMLQQPPPPPTTVSYLGTTVSLLICSHLCHYQKDADTSIIYTTNPLPLSWLSRCRCRLSTICPYIILELHFTIVMKTGLSSGLFSTKSPDVGLPGWPGLSMIIRLLCLSAWPFLASFPSLTVTS